MTTNKKFCSENKFTHQERYQTSTFPRTTKAPLVPCKPQLQSSEKSIRQTLSLISFVKKYSSSLPIRVSVVEGYSGRDDRSEISSGDMFDFHFLKTETVMSIKDNFGKTYYIPFSSPAKFGILYNPCNNLQRAKTGYAFTTVSDIVDYDKPPYIIRATTKFAGGGPQNSVYANEVLIIKTVGFGATRNDHYIKVYSLLSNKEKMLHGDCSGNFVTGPTGVALHPTDILQFFSHILPLRAVVVVNADVTDEFILHLESQIVTLYGTSTEYSVIATPLAPNSSRFSMNTDGHHMAISIPNDLKIKVAAIENQPDDDELFRNTRDLFESLDLTKVKDLRRPACSSAHSAQLHFYEEIGREGRHPSIVFKKPERVYAKLMTSSKIPPRSSAYTLPNPFKTRHMLSTSELLQLPPRRQLMGSSPASKSLSTSSLPSSPRPTGPRRNQPLKALPIGPALRKATELGGMEQPVHSCTGHDKGSSSSQIEHDLNPSTPTPSTTNLHSIRMSPFRGSTVTVKRASSLKSTLHEPLAYYHCHPSSLKRSESCKSKDAKEIMRNNVKELQKMDHEQILVLLSKMNLNQHKQRFTEEHIDGAVLSECDEEVLQFELGISDETQRTRLINVIKGIDSTKDYV